MPNSLTLKAIEPQTERSGSPPHDSPRPTPPGSPFADGSLDRNASPTAKMARDDEPQDSRPWKYVRVPKKHFAWLSKMCAESSGAHIVGCFQGHLKGEINALLYYEVAIPPRHEDVLSKGSKRPDEIIPNDFTVPYDLDVDVHGKVTAGNRATGRINTYFKVAWNGLSSGKGEGLDLYYRQAVPPKLRSRIEWMLVLRDILESKEEVFRRVIRCFLAVSLILVGDNHSTRTRDLIPAGQQQWRAWFQKLALTEWRWHLNHVIACLRLILQVSGGKAGPGPLAMPIRCLLGRNESPKARSPAASTEMAVDLIEGLHQQQLGYHLLYRVLWLHKFLGFDLQYWVIWDAHHDSTVAASILLAFIQVNLRQRQKTLGTTVQEKLRVLGEIESGLWSSELAVQPPSAHPNASAIPQDFDLEPAMEDIRAFGASRLNIPLIPEPGTGFSHSNMTYCVAVWHASRCELPEDIIQDPQRFVFLVWSWMKPRMQASE
ncbi:hypothetical protein ACJZ2D_013313 [Fusarium nematophilum]